jgi:hypothetical protein
MHSVKNYSVLSIVSFIIALIFYIFYNQWIIVTILNNNKVEFVQSSLCKKEITLHYFHHEKWNNEKQELLWSNSIAKNSYQLINAWLTLLDEEGIISKKITLQTALLSTSGTLYLSFDNNILSKEDTIFKKWMLIEGLLKTIKENNIAIQSIQFLIQHQPLIDYHLDFSMPWPAQGFIKS